jgi:cytochrome c biogenesis protein CcmG/thiol:disulfide interchange protein DsbE
MRRGIWIVATLALVAVLVIGLTQAGKENSGDAKPPAHFDVGAAKRKLATAPGALGALYARGDELIGGGRKAFDRQLAALRGHPVVINKWASWCRPCRAEFPIFQRVAATRGTTVAFIGLNGKDKSPAAKGFLASEPLPYPSFEDPGEDVARSLKAPTYYPTTVFVDRRGHVTFRHLGEYKSEHELITDIDRYLD